MLAFYDPNNGNQVMAVYSHDTASTAWADQGFLSIRTDLRPTRDHKLTIKDGKVTALVSSVNPVQPVPKVSPAAQALSDYEAAAAAATTDAEKTAVANTFVQRTLRLMAGVE
ncbi:hypothetical protein CMI37_20140 [Candidatus Pacearchaeota archaeon]|nr:hypothetical protein [Candidatus Pacearchaeota archaeon]|tara:strand:- start:57 stop:392 length:336 start_codon:yes stop_codon:yes gene_type:complete